MTDPDPPTEERERRHLHAIAYRMLGSVTEAEAAVQESLDRLTGSERAENDEVGRPPTIAVAGVSLEMLRARGAREEYFGTWLPEPIVTLPSGEADPEQEADPVALTVLVSLERLAPEERVALVLHDMFAVPFDEIAPILGGTPAAAKELAARARDQMQATAPRTDRTLQRGRAAAFLAAAGAGDSEALLAVLHPDVTLRADTGGLRHRVRPTLSGAAAVSRQALLFGQQLLHFGREVDVNGAPGLAIAPEEKPIAIFSFTLADGRIFAIDVIADSEKLQYLTLHV